MAQAGRALRALWPGRGALSDRLGGRPRLPLLTQSRAGFAGGASGRQGRPRLLGATALALGGALGLYHTVRWHLCAQDLRAERPAAQVRPGWQSGFAPNPGLLGPRPSPPADDLGRVTSP